MRLSSFILLAAGSTLVLSGTVVTASTHSIDVSTIASPGVAGGNQVVGGARCRCVTMTTTIATTKKKQVMTMINHMDYDRMSVCLFEQTSCFASVFDDGGLTMVKRRFRKWESKEYNSYNLPDAMSGERYDQLRKKLHSWAYHGHL
ncbi:LOW QUALITY PROTEIN: hypothetical protein PHMEG_00031950 [Phytophthora megakarya]|uniref:RxLR effector protein n=1 Tax=Phytophthora megakarya TaxID=4795 RepID=A0A225UX31_9STRA|nr:LOW QUALITY PROTEIN: hypothetical protein PHMEG_00031950 [Phytophthora megakarya]